MRKIIGGWAFKTLQALFWLVGASAFLLFFYTIGASHSLYLATLQESSPIAGPIGSGLFGDAFGFVTSLFTGAAFLGLMLTMVLQRQELHATNNALDNQRETNQKLLSQAKAEHLEQRFYVLLEQLRLKSRNEKLELLRYAGRSEMVLDLIEHLAAPDLSPGFTDLQSIKSGYSAFFEPDKAEIFGLIFSSGATEALLANQTLNELRQLEIIPSSTSKHGYIDKLSHLLADAIPKEIATLYALALARSLVRHRVSEPNFFEILSQLILQGFNGEETESRVRKSIQKIEATL